MSDASGFRPLSLAELKALEIPARQDIIDGLLPAGSTTLYAAREKSGKTIFATDAACSIALDEPFLDRAVQCRPVIFVALEEHIRDVRARILTRLGPRQADDTLPLYVLPANGFTDAELRLDNLASVEAFAAMIRVYEAGVVFLDTFRESHGLRENEADDMAPLLRPVRQIAHTENCAIVLIHHMSRAGNARGSTAIAGSVDQIWTFRRADADTDTTAANPAGVFRVEGRFGPPLVLGIALGEGLRWQTDAAPLLHDRTLRGRILACLRQHPDGLTAAEIAHRLDAKPKTIQNEMTRLLREDPAPVVTSGSGKKGDARRYRAVAPELWPDDDPDPAGARIVPDSQPPRDRDLGTIRGTIRPNGSHPSGNNGTHAGNDPDAIEMIPYSQTLRGTGIGNNPGLGWEEGEL